MRLKDKIQGLVAGYIAAVWPLPEHKPSGKPVDVAGGKALLVFDFSTEQELKIIEAFATDPKEHIGFISFLAYDRNGGNGIAVSGDDVFIVGRNDFNIFGRTKHRLSNWLVNNDFDLLISFAGGNELFCNKLISSIPSGFKAGTFHRETVNLFDLTIKQGTGSFGEQLGLFVHYLNELNINGY